MDKNFVLTKSMLPVCDGLSSSENEIKVKNDNNEKDKELSCEEGYCSSVCAHSENCSSSSSGGDSDIEGELVIPQCSQETLPEFGNISVTNSTDIHFGNKTFYQGPVTIKQIVYANPAGGEDLDALPEKLNKGIIGDIIENKETIYVNGDNIKNGQINKANGFQNGNGIANNISASGDKKRPKWIKTWSLKKSIWLVSIITVLIMTSVLAIVLTKKTTQLSTAVVGRNSSAMTSNNNNIDEQDIINVPIESPVDQQNGVHISKKLKIIPRKQWLAQPPEQTDPLTHPVPYVIIWHTATENCTDDADCIFAVRNIQTFHIDSKHWWDIAYNFLIGGNGFAYEGRGWDVIGSHSYGYNNISIGISFIGTFISVVPNEEMIRACQQLIQKGVEDGIIAKNYKLLAARQITTTQAPGRAFYENIKTWPHWATKP